MFCIKCGNQLIEESAFCIKCGAQQGSAVMPQQTQMQSLYPTPQQTFVQ